MDVPVRARVMLGSAGVALLWFLGIDGVGASDLRPPISDARLASGSGQTRLFIRAIRARQERGASGARSDARRQVLRLLPQPAPADGRPRRWTPWTSTERRRAGADVWEKVVRKLRAGAMPPAGGAASRARGRARRSCQWLEAGLERAAGGSDRIRAADLRCTGSNRAEYANAIRDLLAAGDRRPARCCPPTTPMSTGSTTIAEVLSVSPGADGAVPVRGAGQIGQAGAWDAPSRAGDVPRSTSVPTDAVAAQPHERTTLPFGSTGRRSRSSTRFPADGESTPQDSPASRICTTTSAASAGRTSSRCGWTRPASACSRLERSGPRAGSAGQFCRRDLRNPGVGTVHARRRHGSRGPLSGARRHPDGRGLVRRRAAVRVRRRAATASSRLSSRHQ